jgi:hypothetical protein
MPALIRLPMPKCFRIGIVGLGAVLAIAAFTASAQASTYKLPPVGQDQWYWQIGGGSLPSMTAAYPAPGSANIWDTDDFSDANSMGSNNEPNGPSTIVSELHASGKYSICYIEAGAQQAEPDQSDFASTDYTNGSSTSTTQMQGYPGEYWYDLRGFVNYKYGDSDSVLSGAASNIAAGLAQRIEGCAAEGQDAIEPDDLDGYTNTSQSGAAGGGWGMTQADAAGFEAWLATTAHADGLAIFQKNDGANSSVDEPYFDGMIIEECNYYDDPCSGTGGDATAYLAAHKPVLNAEYTQDGESTSKFCSADIAAGITGALFDVNLAGGTYGPCAPVGTVTGGGSGTGTTGGGGGTGGTGGTGTGGTGGTGTGGTGGTGTGGTGGTGTGGTGGTGTGGTGGTGTGGTGGTGTTGKAPVNTTAPALTGTAKQGDKLKVSTGSWSGSPTSFTYSWERCASTCTVVANATRSSYSLGSGDVGYRLMALVKAKNATGSTTAASGRSAVVTSTRKQARAARAARVARPHTLKRAHAPKRHHRKTHARR